MGNIRFMWLAGSSEVLHQTFELVETHGTTAIPGRTNEDALLVKVGRWLVAGL